MVVIPFYLYAIMFFVAGIIAIIFWGGSMNYFERQKNNFMYIVCGIFYLISFAVTGIFLGSALNGIAKLLGVV